MNNIIKQIKIDVYTPTFYEVIKAQQNDENSRFVEFILYNQGEPYVIPENVLIKLEGQRANKSPFMKPCTVANNVVTVELDKDLLYYSGIAHLKLVIYKEDENSVLSTIPFTVSIQKNPLDSNKFEKDNYSLVHQLVLQTETNTKNLNNEIERAKEAEKVITDNLDAEITRAKKAESNLNSKKANIDNPTFTGIPKAPTASAGTNTTQLATTAFTQNAVANHNTSASSHVDIRDLIEELTSRLNALADSDDTTLDQLSEIVAYIKNNKTLIDGITTSKVNVSDIIDSLTSTATNKPLSAKQGKVLNDLITTLTSTVGTKADESDLTSHTNNKNNPHGVTKSQVGLGNVPNVVTNNQTPTFTETTTLAKLTSGEKLSVAFGKISKAITDLISHIRDTAKHITSAERTNWNAAKTHADSAHAPSNAQPNQNAFSKISIISDNGAVLLSSNKEEGTLNLNAGQNITFYTDNTDSITISCTAADTAYGVATSSSLGLVKSGTDITVDSSGNVSVKDDSHNHTIANVDGLLNELNGKSSTGHVHNYAGSSSPGGAAKYLDGFKTTTTSSLGINSIDVNQAIGYVSNLTKAAWNGNQTDGALYRQTYSAAWVHQIFGDYRTGQIAVRGRSNGTWTAWRTILDTTNYNAYALPLTGGTVSGTINSSKATDLYISGNQGQAIINSTASAGGYTMLDRLNSTNGYFTDGVYENRREFHYTSKATVDAGMNTVDKNLTLLDEGGNSSFPGDVSIAGRVFIAYPNPIAVRHVDGAAGSELLLQYNNIGQAIRTYGPVVHHVGTSYYLNGTHCAFENGYGINSNSWGNAPLFLYTQSYENTVNGGRPYIGFECRGYSASSFYYDIDGYFHSILSNGGAFRIDMTSVSDKRMKNDLGLLSATNEDEILIDNIDIHKFAYKNDDDKTIHYGMMAQDVRDVLIKYNIGYRPFLQINHYKNGRDNTPIMSKDLYVSEEECTYNMDYKAFIPVLWHLVKKCRTKIKEQKNIIDEQSEILQHQSGIIDELTRRIEKIENCISEK